MERIFIYKGEPWEIILDHKNGAKLSNQVQLWLSVVMRSRFCHCEFLSRFLTE